MGKQIEKVTPSPTALPVMPEFMSGAGQVGTEILRDFVVPPRIKVVQRQSANELLQSFGVGDIILTPSLALIREMERDGRGNATGNMKPVKFVPLFFYPEWCQWTDYAKRGNLSSIIFRTQDPNHPLRAKATNPKLRTEKHPQSPDVPVHNVEHLNFLIMLLDHELAGEGMLLSFARGEHFAGSKFAGLLQMRRAPIYGCVFEMVTSHRPGSGKGDWWGVDVRNPTDGSNPWITDKEQFEVFKTLHEQFAEAHKKGIIQAQYEESEAEEDAAATPALTKF